ncbi:hypothetical protein ID866_13062 [Astraeus odoratus]|nr:hypothetical protein ID866_13062 [Astraeus odoratus]
MQPSYHVIFVGDRSGSMTTRDRRPLRNTPLSARIVARSDDRFGAVLCSLHSFWSARATAVGSSPGTARRDANSVILFSHNVETPIEHAFNSSPDQLLETLLRYQGHGGTDFTAAINHAQVILERHWGTERLPVIIFLSDGECSIADETMDDLCRTSVRLGKPVSFHAVSFGQDAESDYLRRMIDIARNAQNNAPGGAGGAAATATVPSSSTSALDTVRFFVLCSSFGLASRDTGPTRGDIPRVF